MLDDMWLENQIGNLTKMTELYPFLESKTWYLEFCDHVTSNENPEITQHHILW